MPILGTCISLSVVSYLQSAVNLKEPDMSKNMWLELVKLILGAISGPLHEQIVKSVQEWEKKAKETADPMDDLLVAIVKWVLCIP